MYVFFLVVSLYVCVLKYVFERKGRLGRSEKHKEPGVLYFIYSSTWFPHWKMDMCCILGGLIIRFL